MAAKLKYDQRGLQRSVRALAAANLRRAGTFYRDQCRRAVGRNNPGNLPSRPGQPPRKKTGAGQASIILEHDDSVPAVRVGVENEGMHMIRLELGTSRVKPRPWLVSTLIAHRRTIGRLAASGAVANSSNAEQAR